MTSDNQTTNNDGGRLYQSLPAGSFIIAICVLAGCLYIFGVSIADELSGLLAGISGLISALLWLAAARSDQNKLANAAAATISGAAAAFTTTGAVKMFLFIQDLLFLVGISLALITLVAAVWPFSRRLIFGQHFSAG
jgi:hypothetical protein